MARKINVTALGKKRAGMHVLIGVIILIIAKLNAVKTMWFLFWLLIFGVIISLLSLRFKFPFFSFMLEKFEKPQYIRVFPGKGVLFIVAGCLLVLKLFPKDIALASIAILTFADPVSHLIGSTGRLRYRKPFDRRKNIEGTVAGIFIGFFTALFFFEPTNINIFVVACAACTAMFAEALILKLGGDDVDDNVVIPLAAGTIMYLLFKIFTRV